MEGVVFGRDPWGDLKWKLGQVVWHLQCQKSGYWERMPYNVGSVASNLFSRRPYIPAFSLINMRPFFQQ